MGCELGAGVRAVGFFVGLHVGNGEWLGGVAVWQLVGQWAGAGNHVGALGILAGRAHQVARGGGVGLVDLALVATLFDGLLWHPRTAAGGDD